MAVKSPKSVWEKNEIPALEYCSLRRAATLLGCEADDLLHWAEVGAIELCLKFDGFRATLRMPLASKADPEGWIKNIAPHFAEITYLSELSGFWFDGEHMADPESGEAKVKYYFEYEEQPFLKRPIVYIYGVWAILPYALIGVIANLIADKNHVFNDTNFIVKPADDESTPDSLITSTPMSEHLYEKYLRKEDTEQLFTITMDDLLISRKQIDKIHNSIGSRIPSIISGDVENFKMDHKGRTLNSNIRTTAKQSDYIVGLLKSLGIKDNELTGSITELRAKIARASRNHSLPDIDDNTLIDWLRRAGVNR
ncbi:hypothetical protein ACN2AS_24225 [Serratia liquefaciens]|uniref:hypothetical protein n=1 Tax=Serratia liquefaciens TaxID=614 RepID=UPI003AF3F160